MKFKSFDEILKAQQDAKKDENKLSIDTNLKSRKSIELEQKIGVAKLAVMDKQTAFEKAVTTPGVSVDTAALELQSAETTLSFYEKLHKELFIA